MTNACFQPSSSLRTIVDLVFVGILCAAQCFAVPTLKEPSAETDKSHHERNWSAPERGNAQAPCAAATHREFDFWIGEWNVTSQGKKVAESSIQRIIEGCVIYENYSQGNNYTGKSFNFYDSTLKQWRQTWVDSGGNVSEFAGQLKDGAMHYAGETHLRDGSRVLRRMVVSSLGPDRVRQYSERSTDGGQTWTEAYDFIYERKK